MQRSKPTRLAVVAAWGALLLGCGGPARYPTPAIEDTGASRAGPSSLVASQEQAAPAPPAGASYAPAPAPAPAPPPAPAAVSPSPPPLRTPPWAEAPAPAPAPALPPAPALAPAPAPVPAPSPASAAVPVPAADGLAFLDGFAARAAAVPLQEPRVIAVLPAFHHNALFHRYEVSQLGEDVGQRIVDGLQRSLGGKAALVSPAMFERRVRESNRALGDLDSPEAAVALSRRIGARYLVRGLITDSARDIGIRVEMVDVQELLPVEDAQQVFRAGEPYASAVQARFRTGVGEVIPGSFHIGSLAPPASLPVQAELQLIITDAVHRLLEEAGKGLEGLPVAVLLTQVPGEIQYVKFQRAFERAVEEEKKRLMGLGLNESQALGQVPVRILGLNFQNLREARDHASEKDLQRKVSAAGELRDTFSRIVFEIAEDAGERRGVVVIPHDQLIDQAMLLQKEEAAKVGEGSLNADTRAFFKTKGAGALLFNELIESGDSYELVFQLRRLDNLQRLTGQMRQYLEPRFAVQLAEFLKK